MSPNIDASKIQTCPNILHNHLHCRIVEWYDNWNIEKWHTYSYDHIKHSRREHFAPPRYICIYLIFQVHVVQYRLHINAVCVSGIPLLWKLHGKDILIWLHCYSSMVNINLTIISGLKLGALPRKVNSCNTETSLCSRSWYSCTNRGNSRDSFEFGLLWWFSRCSCISSSSRYSC